MNAHTSGTIGETLASSYLASRGMTVIAKNYRRAGGEIDLIARDGETVVFVEVKARRSPRYGRPAEAVTPAKSRHIVRAALAYLQAQHWLDRPVRFDVIAIEGEDIQYLPAAFDATDLF